MRCNHAVSLFLVMITAVLFSACATTQVASEKQPDYDAIIIGAGMGGLSTAAHLASGGMHVLVLEQHHKVGGCTTSFSRGDFKFDAALHEMTGGGGDGPLGKMLKECGVWDKVEFIRIPDLYRSIFPGVDFTYPGNVDEAVKRLSERWPAEAENIKAFHDLMRDIYTETGQMSDLYRLSGFERAGKMLMAPVKQPHLVKYLKTPLQKVLDDYFQDPELKAVISQFWVYYGPPPSDLWTIMFMSANYSYLDQGAWQIKGSSQALSNAYADRIGELGGTVKTGTRVTSILVDNKRAYGVKTEDGKTYSGRYIISNADPFQTFFKLVGEEKTPASYVKRIRSLKPANSLVGIYLGLDVEPSFWNCKDHEIFYNSSLSADENYKNMMEGNYEKAACAITFYSNLGDPFYAPKGKSVLVLHAYSEISKWPEDRENYQAKKEKVANELIALTENVFPDLHKHIEVMEIITPRTLEAFTMQKDGIPYGWIFSSDQGMRLENDTPIEGLYLAGSWTNPGHGVSTAQISGYQAAHLILDKEGENK